MRYAYIPLALMSFTLLASSCEKDSTQPVSADLFTKDWYYNRQPESAGFRTYILNPVPNRGIDGFRLEPGGGFVLHTNAPNDVALDIPGTWTTTDGERFHITPGNPLYEEFDLLINSVTTTSLQAQKIQ